MTAVNSGFAHAGSFGQNAGQNGVFPMNGGVQSASSIASNSNITSANASKPGDKKTADKASFLVTSFASAGLTNPNPIAGVRHAVRC